MQQPHATHRLSLSLSLSLQGFGLPEPEALLASYYAARGLPYPDPYVPYYLGFYWWKTAVILQGVAARAIAGQASSAQAKKVGALTPLVGMLANSKLSEFDDAMAEKEGAEGEPRSKL